MNGGRELAGAFQQFIQTQGFHELVGIGDREIILKYIRESIIEKFGVDKGYIVTPGREERLEVRGKVIEVVNGYNFLMKNDFGKLY